MSDRVAELRHAFDHAFSQAPHVPAATKKYLVLATAADRWAVRLDDVAGVVPARSITPLPARTHALLGLAGHRGIAIAVYDLSVLLGHAPTEAVRWMVLCGPDLGLGFSTVQAWIEAEGAVATLRIDDKACVVIDVRSILEDLKKRITAPTIGR